MRRAKSKYKIGDTWEGKDKRGRIGRIWLADIYEYEFEIWKWSWIYNDGSGGDYGWNTSYYACKKEIPVYCRFKRIK